MGEDDDLHTLVGPKQIKVLLTIIETRSFSRAAVSLGVTQPTISQHIKRLEQVSGRILFRRTRAGIELTDDGEAIIVYARAMLALTNELRRKLSQSGEIKISIGMAEDFCRTALPSVLFFFIREHPNIKVKIISGTYETLTAAIESRTVDFAVMRRYPRFPDAKLLWSDKLVWFGRKDLPLPIRDPVPLVLPTAPNPVRDVLTETMRACGRPWNVTFESATLAGIEAALQAGLGLCTGPRSMRIHGAKALGFELGLPELPNVDFVLVEARQDVPAATRAFLEVIQMMAKSNFRAFAPQF